MLLTTLLHFLLLHVSSVILGAGPDLKYLSEIWGPSQKRQLESYERLLDVKDTQISELHVLLQTVQKTLPAPQDHKRWWWPFG